MLVIPSMKIRKQILTRSNECNLKISDSGHFILMKNSPRSIKSLRLSETFLCAQSLRTCRLSFMPHLLWYLWVISDRLALWEDL